MKHVRCNRPLGMQSCDKQLGHTGKCSPPIQFETLSPFEKGYAVYWFGDNEDYPNIPKRYAPTPAEKAEYERGQAAACQDAQDSP